MVSWSVVYRNHSCCVNLQDMGLGLSGSDLTETTYDEVGQNLVAGSRVSYNSMVDYRSRQPVMSTGVMSDYIGCQDAGDGGEWSEP